MPHCCSWGPGSDSSGERDSWCGQGGTWLCSRFYRPRSISDWDSPLLASPSLAAGGPGASCRDGHLWVWRGLEQHVTPLLQPLPEAARGRSHLCLLASILCFSGGKVVSRQLLWETEAPGYLLQRRGLLASAVPSQLGSKAQLAVLGSALRSSVKCPGGGQNVII